MRNIINSICVSLLFISGNTFAMLINGSFEHGLRGWSAIGYVHQTNYWSSLGSFSAALTPAYSLPDIESKLGLQDDSFDSVVDLVIPGSRQTMKASIIYQSLMVNAGDNISISFDVARSSELNGWNYGAMVFFENGMLRDFHLISALVATTGASCLCDCESGLGMFNASVSGNATIGFIILNEKDAYNNPVIKLDNINANISAIPVPAAGWLFISGMSCMLGILQKRKIPISRFS